MCGRYTLTLADRAALARQLGVPLDAIPEDAIRPRYNIAPLQRAPIVRLRLEEREALVARWGLVNSWAKDAKRAARQINARAETVHEKPSFRSSFRKRRCLVPADGFYEWQVRGEGKSPQYIRLRTGGLFAFAGLWSEWDSGQETLRTFTIITTTANRELESIHHRMPVILLPEQYDGWMDPETSSDPLKNTLRPLGEGLLDHYEISKTVNSPKNDSEECIQPVHDRRE